MMYYTCTQNDFQCGAQTMRLNIDAPCTTTEMIQLNPRWQHIMHEEPCEMEVMHNDFTKVEQINFVI